MRSKIGATAFNAYDSRRRIAHGLHELAGRTNAPRLAPGGTQSPNSSRRRGGIDMRDESNRAPL
jgi:hypothetical protein